MLAATAGVTRINLGLPAHRIHKKLKSDSESLEDNLYIPTQPFLALRPQSEDCRHSTAKFLKYHLYSPFSPKFLKSLFSLSSPSHSAHTISSDLGSQPLPQSAEPGPEAKHRGNSPPQEGGRGLKILMLLYFSVPMKPCQVAMFDRHHL